MKNKLNLQGDRFGRLTAVYYISGSKSKKSKWHCVCDCGSTKEVSTGNLTNGKTKSCGCLTSELTTKRNIKHGMTNKKVYKTWSAIINRCNNPNATRYENYGGRGIKVCDKWLSFLGFYEDMGDQPEGHSIERIDVDGGYSADNCIWIQNSKQAANKRIFKNNTSGFKGVTVSGGKVIAHWYTGGRQRTKNFSIKKYGFDLAFKKAKEEREKQINKLIEKGENYGKYK